MTNEETKEPTRQVGYHLRESTVRQVRLLAATLDCRPGEALDQLVRSKLREIGRLPENGQSTPTSIHAESN